MRLGYDLRIQRYPPGGTTVYTGVIQQRMADQRASSWDVIAMPGWTRLDRGGAVPAPIRRVANLGLDIGWIGVGGTVASMVRRLDCWLAPALPMPATLRCPSVLIIHGIDHLVRPDIFDAGFRRAAGAIARLSARRATRIAAPSEHVRAIVVERLGIDPDRVTTIRWGLDHLPPPEPERLHARPYALATGQTTSLWNFDVLLDAWRAGAGGELDLVISGPFGKDERRLRQRIEADGLGDRVRFTGHVTTARLMSLMRDAEIFVYTGLADDRGLAPLEAMLYAVPTAVANRSGLPEVTAGAAITFDPDDRDEVIDVVKRLREDEALRGRLRREGPPVARKLSWNDTATALWREVDLAMAG